MGDQFRMTNNQLERLRALLGAKTTPDGRLLRGSPRGAKSHGEDCWCACCIRRLLAAHDRYFQAWSRRALSGEKGMSDIAQRLVASTLDKDNCPRMDSERWLPIGLAREAASEIERLRAALRLFYEAPCPICGGDCASANPPVIGCPMIEARKALGANALSAKSAESEQGEKG